MSPKQGHWELLVVDNDSHDNTREVIQNFARTAVFPVHYFFERQQGKSSALKAGIAAAEGDIIASTDDDMVLRPDWLAKLAGAFERFD